MYFSSADFNFRASWLFSSFSDCAEIVLSRRSDKDFCNSWICMSFSRKAASREGKGDGSGFTLGSCFLAGSGLFDGVRE